MSVRRELRRIAGDLEGLPGELAALATTLEAAEKELERWREAGAHLRRTFKKHGNVSAGELELMPPTREER